LKKSSLQYGLISKIALDGGFIVILMVRFSAIPPHCAYSQFWSHLCLHLTSPTVATVIFSLCGLDIFTFLAAAVLSLPRQLASVYLGAVAEAEANHTETHRQSIASGVIVAFNIVSTIVAMRYITVKVDAAKPEFIYARRKARCVPFLGFLDAVLGSCVDGVL
jgi:hypothetical protein